MVNSEKITIRRIKDGEIGVSLDWNTFVVKVGDALYDILNELTPSEKSISLMVTVEYD